MSTTAATKRQAGLVQTLLAARGMLLGTKRARLNTETLLRDQNELMYVAFGWAISGLITGFAFVLMTAADDATGGPEIVLRLAAMVLALVALVALVGPIYRVLRTLWRRAQAIAEAEAAV